MAIMKANTVPTQSQKTGIQIQISGKIKTVKNVLFLLFWIWEEKETVMCQNFVSEQSQNQP